METKAEYNVCADELETLILEVQDAGVELGVANEWGTGTASAIKRAGEARAALREYVDALVSNGITAQIAENLEQIDALQTRITAMEFANDAFFQVIQAQVGRIAELEKSIVYAGRREEYLQSEIRERDA